MKPAQFYERCVRNEISSCTCAGLVHFWNSWSIYGRLHAPAKNLEKIEATPQPGGLHATRTRIEVFLGVGLALCAILRWRCRVVIIHWNVQRARKMMQLPPSKGRSELSSNRDADRKQVKRFHVVSSSAPSLKLSFLHLANVEWLVAWFPIFAIFGLAQLQGQHEKVCMLQEGFERNPWRPGPTKTYIWSLNLLGI